MKNLNPKYSPIIENNGKFKGVILWQNGKYELIDNGFSTNVLKDAEKRIEQGAKVIYQYSTNFHTYSEGIRHGLFNDLRNKVPEIPLDVSSRRIKSYQEKFIKILQNPSEEKIFKNHVIPKNPNRERKKGDLNWSWK